MAGGNQPIPALTKHGDNYKIVDFPRSSYGYKKLA